ncbi:LLM class flavin-dependent oxidoreductase [Ilumatobacter coccineus]|uniref:Putative oxidoreductase n=1 Tax=Ilumatobacter coccineus (strain NBRC 103263 / KCTC 29153 / YM16-304) TaxID=1313172 RepID=A0A6C7E977_ILUCY|nr:LLM class flavin-dependent oxidoreductase [Ilumatobacter coccineus]BAN01695.1 putative oxidoreductase [Ilumatobacter coccineus YM16-304]
MKVRIGFGLGTRTRLHDETYGAVVDALEAHEFDSLWLSEKISGEAPDPLVAMAYGAGRTTKLKFGMSVMVLPGRNPVVLAKELATLATMSGGRLLPAFGLGAVDPVEQQAFGVERKERAAIFDETLAVMRKCWTGEPFSHAGERFSYDGVVVQPAPKRMDVWLGGYAPSELKRIGRLADGWLPSFVLPSDAEAGRAVIEQVAAEHDREIEDDHYGVLIPYAFGPVPDVLTKLLQKRRPDLDDVTQLVPDSWDALQKMVQRFVDVGTTKFVALPIAEPGDADAWVAHLAEAADALKPLEVG